MTLGETTLEQNINGSEERQHKIQDADEFRKALAKSKGALTQEERRALFHKKAEVGRRKTTMPTTSFGRSPNPVCAST